MNGEDIKNLRKKLKLSQKDFGAKIGVSRQTIVNYENGDKIPDSKKQLLSNLLQEEAALYKTQKQSNIYIEKGGVKFTLEEACYLVAKYEKEALQENIFKNIIHKNSLKMILSAVNNDGVFDKEAFYKQLENS